MLVTLGRAAFFPELSKQRPDKVLEQNIMHTSASPSRLAVESSPANEGEISARIVFDAIKNIDFVVILSSFVFFFLGGYLLYGALFAAIGSLADNEADTQQFMLPVTIPLILAIYVMISTINNPDSALSFWFSIIPFTSPIVMMVRIPFGVQYWELALSMALLVAAFVFFTWFSAKIYRTAILMYGKQISYKEIWKWFKQS
jgi:ABC-2 type transport system permease protein